MGVTQECAVISGDRSNRPVTDSGEDLTAWEALVHAVDPKNRS